MLLACHFEDVSERFRLHDLILIPESIWQLLNLSTFMETHSQNENRATTGAK